MRTARTFFRPELITFFALFLLVVFSSVHAELRTWVDRSGKFEIQAEFLEVKQGKARLQKSDGTIVNIPLAKLSKQDQLYLRDLVKRRKQDSGNNKRDQQATNPLSTKDLPQNFSIHSRTTIVNGERLEEFSVSFGDEVDDQSSDEPNGLRTWVDSTGKHKIDAMW